MACTIVVMTCVNKIGIQNDVAVLPWQRGTFLLDIDKG